MTENNNLINEVIKLRKDLDLEKEEHQLTQLKYESMKSNLDKLIGDKLNAARDSIKEIVDDGNK